MAKCDVTIHLDKAGRTYEPGERVRGHVNVSTDAAVKCKSLTATLQWQTHGRGNTSKGPASQVELFQGEWGGGEQHAYGFEFIAPNGPASYRGNYVNLDHYLTARVDLPWAIDPKATTEILVVPKPGSPGEYDHGPGYKPPAAELSSEGKTMVLGSVLLAGCFGLPGLGIMLLGVSLGIAWMRGNSGQGAPAIFTFLFGSVFALVGFGLAVLIQKRNLAQRKLGNPLVNVSPTTARGGDRISVQVTLQPRARVKLTGAKVVLRCKERAVSGSGTNKTTHTHEVHESEAGLNCPPQLEAGQPASFSASVPLPKDAPATLVAGDYNDVKWTVTLNVGIDGWPDWERDYPITVRP